MLMYKWFSPDPRLISSLFPYWASYCMASRLLDEGERGSVAPENILFHFFACVYTMYSIYKNLFYSTVQWTFYLDRNKKTTRSSSKDSYLFTLFLSVGSADPDTESDSGSGSNNRIWFQTSNNFENFRILKSWIFSLEGWIFPWSLYVQLSEGLCCICLKN